MCWGQSEAKTVGSPPPAPGRKRSRVCVGGGGCVRRLRCNNTSLLPAPPCTRPPPRSKEPLFQGRSEIEQVQVILKTMGSPTEGSWPGAVAVAGCGGRVRRCAALEKCAELCSWAVRGHVHRMHPLPVAIAAAAACLPWPPAAGVSQLPAARKITLGKFAPGGLRHRVPPAAAGGHRLGGVGWDRA